MVSGFFILLENQFAVGDVVSINGSAGSVEKITLRRTVLRDIKGSVHNITNGSISSVTNMTQGWARVVVNMSVAYGTDLDRAMKVDTVGEEMFADEKWEGKISEAPNCVGVTALGESDITIRAMFKTRTFHNWAAEREFNYRIKNAFEAEGIEIPFPSVTFGSYIIMRTRKTPEWQTAFSHRLAPLKFNLIGRRLHTACIRRGLFSIVEFPYNRSQWEIFVQAELPAR